jgi:hypothetical protein
VLDLVLDTGFEHPDVHKRLDLLLPDLHWPAQQLILEIDSAWHDGPLASELVAKRQVDLESAGERVLRTTPSRRSSRRASQSAGSAPQARPTLTQR